MVAPQSASVVHDASMQVPLVAGGVMVGAGLVAAHLTPTGHAGVVAIGVGAMSSWQVKPFPQSAEVWHAAACAEGARASTAASAPTETKILPSDIERSPFLCGTKRPALPDGDLLLPTPCQPRGGATARSFGPPQSVS
jgi:hypothetical protein